MKNTDVDSGPQKSNLAKDHGNPIITFSSDPCKGKFTEMDMHGTVSHNISKGAVEAQ